MRELPVLYRKKEECCGCTACYAICPKEAISMVEDEEGFEYPKIDNSKCVRCYLCLKVCPFKIDNDSVMMVNSGEPVKQVPQKGN